MWKKDTKETVLNKHGFQQDLKIVSLSSRLLSPPPAPSAATSPGVINTQHELGSRVRVYIERQFQ